MTQLGFSKKTFTYFDMARRNEDNAAWADEHRREYEEDVLQPFTHLIFQMGERLGGSLKGIAFSAKKITKPKRRQVEGLSEPVVRSKTTAFFCEPPTSGFESNPGVYVSLGAADDDNVYGVGLYEVSSRQMKQLRPGILADPAAADACFKNADLLKHWGGLSGERFQRFPRGFEETARGAEYLWHKQFLLSKVLARSDVTSKEFVSTAVDDLAAAVPFLQWLRATVGVYKKQVDSDSFE